MTKPTVVFFGYDTVPRLTPKVFLRTLLYSTSARGQVVEAMHVNLCHSSSDQVFGFWGYGETNKLTAGSGLFVGQTGVSFNHHFVLSAYLEDYTFLEGKYVIQVFARVVGKKKPIKLEEISLVLSKIEAGALAGKLGILFELRWDTGKYVGHAREYRVSGLGDEESTVT
jgi:hypothetical protein